MYYIDDAEVNRFFGEYERKSAPPIAECDFCSGDICKNGKSFVLPDGRYVCTECAESVFCEEFSNLPLSDKAEIIGAEEAFGGE